MKYHKVFSALLVSLFWLAAEAETFDDSTFAHIDYPDWFSQTPFNDLSEVLAESNKKEKKGVFVLYTTEGCSYCDYFIRKALANPGIASKVNSNFESVGLEIFDDTELTTLSGETTSAKQFAKDEKVQFSPTVIFYGNDGKRTFRKTGYLSPEEFDHVLNYLINGEHRTTSYKRYLAREKAKAPATPLPDEIELALTENPLFIDPSYILDRSISPASTPLLVLFEKKSCPDCRDYHAQVLSDPEITNTLKMFEVIRLDAEDDKTPVLAPDGKRTSPAQWYKETTFTRVPALLFFDENGKEVLTTDALVLHQRMMNSMKYVLEEAYKKGWSYQRFARTKAIERSNRNSLQANE